MLMALKLLQWPRVHRTTASSPARRQASQGQGQRRVGRYRCGLRGSRRGVGLEAPGARLAPRRWLRRLRGVERWRRKRTPWLRPRIVQGLQRLVPIPCSL